MSEALIIFVRNPELGKVKTRLAATLGQEKALEIYQQLLSHTLAITKNLAAEKYVFYAGAIAEKDMWKEAGYHQVLQKETSLGEKMFDAFKTVLRKKHSKVLIVGSDCIELSPSIIQAAFHQLTTKDVVIGPANDGGYYLLGMKQLYKQFFISKEWSSDTVYRATIDNFKELGLSYYELPVLIDIDTKEDWLQAMQKTKKSPGK
jgi:rSAM/selenodomain-associated transferase 1